MRTVAACTIAAISVAICVGAGCASLVGADFDRPSPAQDEGGTSAAPDGGAVDAPCVSDDSECAGRCGELKGRCGTTIRCGGCPDGQSCGGGGPNRCGQGSCSPGCAGKACGDSDGCSGICDVGVCSEGAHCAAGTCVCDDLSCAGCCSGKACLPGTTNFACGAGGAACAACGTGQNCGGGSCGTCGGAGQPCCAGGQCTSPLTCGGGTTADVCGCTPNCAGKPCGADDGCLGKCATGSCGTGQRCDQGQCICDGTSCPSGCCASNACTPGTSNTACGKNGAPCAACGTNGTCTDQVCHAPALTACTHIPPAGTNCPTICSQLGKSCTNKCVDGGVGGLYFSNDAVCTTAPSFDFACTGDVFQSTSSVECCCM